MVDGDMILAAIILNAAAVPAVFVRLFRVRAWRAAKATVKRIDIEQFGDSPVSVPTLAYEYGGCAYVQTYEGLSGSDRYRIGEARSIIVNPRRPTEILLGSKKALVLLAATVVLSDLVFVLLSSFGF